MQKVRSLSSQFTSFKIEHVPHEQNFGEYLMSKIDTLKMVVFNITVIQETLSSSSIKSDEIYTLEVVFESSWMSPILCYLQTNELPLDEGEERRILKQDSKYTLLSGNINKLGGLIPCCSA